MSGQWCPIAVTVQLHNSAIEILAAFVSQLFSLFWIYLLVCILVSCVLIELKSPAPTCSSVLNPTPQFLSLLESCALAPFAVAIWPCKCCHDVTVIRQNVSYDSAVIQRAIQSIWYCEVFTEGTQISRLLSHCFGLPLDYHYFEMWHWYVLGAFMPKANMMDTRVF